MASALVAMRDGSAIPLVGTILGCVMINIPIVMAGPWLAEKIVSRGITLDRLSFLIAVLFATLGLSVIFDLLP
jgi:putative Ca2+/H+ antiporter (TMEM165/GDT1 family)